MANLKNLKPWKKGQSGNPTGNPPMPDLKAEIAKALNDNNLSEILIAIVHRAKKGDTRAAQLILDRAFGQAKQHIEQTNLNQETPVINVIMGSSPPQAKDENE